jgi:hypothetical protein
MNPKAILIASRTTLTMLLVAAAVLAGLGVFALLRTDPPEVDGWLRAVFGGVFGVVALLLAAILAVPSGIGLWALVGAGDEDSVPSLADGARTGLGVLAVATTAIAAVVCVATGSAVAVLNLGLVALIGLASVGLAGASTMSRHRGRAIASAVALVLVAAGSLWVLYRAFL